MVQFVVTLFLWVNTMSGDNFNDESCKTRPVLDDLTNRPRKRGFSMFSGDMGLNSSVGYGKNGNIDSGDSEFAKQVCLGVENLVREKCRASGNSKAVLMLNEKKTSATLPTYSGSDTLLDNTVPANVSKPDEIKEKSKLLDGGVPVVKYDAIWQNIVKVDDARRDNCLPSVAVPASSAPCEKGSAEEGKVASNLTQGDSANEGLFSCALRSEDKDLGLPRVAARKSGCTELPKSQSSRSFELDRCSALKGSSCANFGSRADLLKNCSCSFCLKAAYIWSDLHYQDIKGRMAVLKKSQKEASMLVQKSSRGKHIDVPGQGNSNKPSILESDLMGRWMSLFLNMGDILARENNQLQASLVTLKDLRENCKMDLERTTGMPSDKH